jgi:hypothetical protein
VWLIDGGLSPIDFEGDADDRFPDELAERVIETFSAPGDWILDPFAGLGTTLFAAKRLGRKAIGFEPNPDRARYVAARLGAPHVLMETKVQDASLDALPKVVLVFTSPPYVTVNLKDDPWGPKYFTDMQTIFERLAGLLTPGGQVVVEVSNVRTADGFRPLASELAAALREVLRQTDEFVRVNTSATPAGPGTSFSSVLVFTRRD